MNALGRRVLEGLDAIVDRVEATVKNDTDKAKAAGALQNSTSIIVSWGA